MQPLVQRAQPLHPALLTCMRHSGLDGYSCATRMLTVFRTRLLGGRRVGEPPLLAVVPQLLDEAAEKRESELFSAITSGTLSLEIQRELEDLGCSCSDSVATDSQSVIDTSQRKGHSVASQHVGLRGLVVARSSCRQKISVGEGVHCGEPCGYVYHQSVAWRQSPRTVSDLHVYTCATVIRLWRMTPRTGL